MIFFIISRPYCFEEQSDHGLQCLPFHLHLLDAILHCAFFYDSLDTVAFYGNLGTVHVIIYLSQCMQF